MKLWQTRRHWDKFARTDPLWAVLTVPGKEGRRWTPEDFFATGESDIATALAAVGRAHPRLRQGRALDFGCGVGRLTQALARKFDQITGVDLSVDMLAHARRFNRHGDRVSYIHTTAADLACFADGSFDLVLSLITLQHVAPEYSRRYIAEFIRVCAPDGVAYFQVPAKSFLGQSQRFTFYPPSLIKRIWRRLNRSLAAAPTMDMHVLPRDEVIALISEAGGEVLAIEESAKAGQDFMSYTYLVRKR